VKIRYCILTLNQFEWVVDQHLPSLDPSLVDGVHIHISEVGALTYNNAEVADPFDVPELITQMNRFSECKVSVSLNNLGVANGWNHFIKEAARDGFDAVVVANDDIILYPGVLDRFVEQMREHDFVCFSGQNAFSFYGMHTRLFEKVGEFDENFWPAYFEDNDYHYRMKLMGLPTAYVEDPSYFHRVSATLTAFDFQRKMMHHHNFRKNTEYFVKKWGGMPHEETYTIPFGYQDADNSESEFAQAAFDRFKSSSAED